MKSFLLEFPESDPFLMEVQNLVDELGDLGIYVTVPEMIVRLAKGVGLNELKQYEISRHE